MINRGLFKKIQATFFLFWFFNGTAVAQLSINIFAVDDAELITVVKLKRNFFKNENAGDSVAAVRICNRFLLDLYDEGYLSASIDTIYISDKIFNAGVRAGMVYKWV